MTCPEGDQKKRKIALFFFPILNNTFERLWSFMVLFYAKVIPACSPQNRIV